MLLKIIFVVLSFSTISLANANASFLAEIQGEWVGIILDPDYRTVIRFGTYTSDQYEVYEVKLDQQGGFDKAYSVFKAQYKISVEGTESIDGSKVYRVQVIPTLNQSFKLEYSLKMDFSSKQSFLTDLEKVNPQFKDNERILDFKFVDKYQLKTEHGSQELFSAGFEGVDFEKVNAEGFVELKKLLEKPMVRGSLKKISTTSGPVFSDFFELDPYVLSNLVNPERSFIQNHNHQSCSSVIDSAIDNYRLANKDYLCEVSLYDLLVCSNGTGVQAGVVSKISLSNAIGYRNRQLCK